jgi:hypothetical protein
MDKTIDFLYPITFPFRRVNNISTINNLNPKVTYTRMPLPEKMIIQVLTINISYTLPVPI